MWARTHTNSQTHTLTGGNSNELHSNHQTEVQPSDTHPLLMFLNRSGGTWQISADTLDCLPHQINQEHVTVTAPFSLYFMLSSLLLSFGTGHCFVTSLGFFFRWLCLVVYFPPSKPLFRNVIASQEEATRGKSVKGTRSVIGKIIDQMSWHLVLKRHKEGWRTSNAVHI